MLSFTLEHTDPHSKARAGEIKTAHNSIQTPIFMPVGTVGTVKAVDQEILKNEIDATIILANTYHLFLRPGIEVLSQVGGLHQFINWDRSILTDSGGYQVYSISENRKIRENGVEFQSHIDGSKFFFTPEKVMDIQRNIGGDIIMAFDECTPYPCDFAYAKSSLNLTHDWLLKCIKHQSKQKGTYGYPQSLFPIVQGSTFKNLRIESAKFVTDQNMEGNAIGGLSVGEPHHLLYEMTDLVTEHLPKEKPRYLMGVGTPANLLECIALGVDMFDCVMPTRNARNGMLFTENGYINIKNEKWKNDFTPIDEVHSPDYSKAYLRHLIRCNEYLGAQIASKHNLKFYLWLMREARAHIKKGDFYVWKSKMVPQLEAKL